jgi:hypothetical protein
MANAYVLDENSIKLPLELSAKLKLRKGMELKVISDGDEGIIVLKVIENNKKNFMSIMGVGKEVWEGTDAQEYVNQERSQWS